MVKRITFSAIALALTVICLYGAATLSTAKLSLLALSAVFCAICVYQYGVRYGVTLYVGASILSLLLVPSRMYVMLYILFIGYYPIVKLYIEKQDKKWVEWLIKMIFFNIILAVLYVLFKAFFMPALNPAMLAFVLKYLGFIILALEVVFALYDWILSYIIGYYDQFIRRISHE